MAEITALEDAVGTSNETIITTIIGIIIIIVGIEEKQIQVKAAAMRTFQVGLICLFFGLKLNFNFEKKK